MHTAEEVMRMAVRAGALGDLGLMAMLVELADNIRAATRKEDSNG